MGQSCGDKNAASSSKAMTEQLSGLSTNSLLIFTGFTVRPTQDDEFFPNTRYGSAIAMGCDAFDGKVMLTATGNGALQDSRTEYERNRRDTTQ